MNTSLIILLSFLGFDLVVYLVMWCEYSHCLSRFAKKFMQFMSEMNEEE